MSAWMAVKTSRISSPAVRRPRLPWNTSRHNGGPVSSMSTTSHETLTKWRPAMPGMRVTLDSAMRARDVSRPRPEHEAAAAGRAAKSGEPRPGGPSQARSQPGGAVQSRAQPARQAQSRAQPGKPTQSVPQPGKLARDRPRGGSNGPPMPAEGYRSATDTSTPGRSDAARPQPTPDTAQEHPARNTAEPLGGSAPQAARANSPRRRKRRRRAR